MGFWYFLLSLIYFAFNYYLACWIYKESSRYYDDNPIHKDVPEFKSYDRLSFTRILIGMEFLFWPKFIIIAISAFFCAASLKYINN